MPSYFFHIKIDLIHPASDIQSIVKQDSKLLTYSKTSKHLLEDTLISDNHLASSQVTKVSKEASSDALAHGQSNNLDQDWRIGSISYESVDMLSSVTNDAQKDAGSSSDSIRTGLSSIYPGLATKARFEPSGKSEEQLGYGIVRLFRDTEETNGLYDLLSTSKSSKNVKKHPVKKIGGSGSTQDNSLAFKNEDCTTLCILTVPTWWDVARLIAFLGDEARDNVSHFRMIRTETAGRYMLLMKFRDGKMAREWRKQWNGKVFDPAAPTEYCHVVFIKSVEIREMDYSGDSAIDPFVGHESSTEVSKTVQLPSIASLGSKPMPPPTRPLQEMPTCPVCLERMDDSSGLLTIPCQHTFHCTCLVKWRKNGCPVCRFTQDDIVRRGSDPNDFEAMNECSICRSDVNLWICLICGSIGCGRYDGAHAYLHWKQTGHSFSLDMTDQRIWDYASDGYVHRIMQNKLDGKMIELPSAAADYDNEVGDEDVIPKAKFEAMGAEYTQLLMSQLDSQRTYYEEKLESAADKASEAARSAAQASDAVTKIVEELSSLQASHNTILKETIPSLERDRDRAERRATKFEEMSRKMEKAWREEKAVVGSLMEKNVYLEKQIKKTNDELEKLAESHAELEDTNRDLLTFVSGREKIKALDDPDIKEGTIVVLGGKKDDEDGKDVKTDKKKRRRAKQRGKGGREEALAALGKSKADTSGEDSRSGASSEAEGHPGEDSKGKGKKKEIVQIHPGKKTTVSEEEE